MNLARTSINVVTRLHDLWILLAWAGIVAAIMLNTFYNRNCFDFVRARNLTATCQSWVDISLIFLAAVGAGIAVTDEKFALLGFIPVHVIASIIFVTVILLPGLIGLADPFFLNILAPDAFYLAFASQIPIPIFSSFIGGILGVYLGGKVHG